MVWIDAQMIFETSGEGQEDPQTGEGVSPSAVREERFE